MSCVEWDALMGRLGDKTRLYIWQLGATPRVTPVTDEATAADLQKKLDAYLATATRSLLEDTAGEDTAGVGRAIALCYHPWFCGTEKDGIPVFCVISHA
jgi:hypothetical protein